MVHRSSISTANYTWLHKEVEDTDLLLVGGLASKENTFKGSERLLQIKRSYAIVSSTHCQTVISSKLWKCKSFIFRMLQEKQCFLEEA